MGGTLLVRPPAATLASGQTTHIERVPIDLALACTQWRAYVDAMSSEGWKIVEVPQADDAPDSVFVEDAIVMFGHVAVLASPGSASRLSEIKGVEATLSSISSSNSPSSIPKLDIRRIEAPGTLDGGDVLKIGQTIYVGRGGRTNASGIAQLRSILSPLGYKVVAVPMTKALHLKSAVTALPDGTVIGYPPILDEDSRGLFERFLPVQEGHGVAVVVLDHGTVLMSANAPRTAAMIADREFLSTFSKSLASFSVLIRLRIDGSWLMLMLTLDLNSGLQRQGGRHL